MEPVLVIDDNASLCDILRLQLEAAEGSRPALDVAIALTAAEAREQLRRLRPLIVLCDMMLPDGDGVTLLPELRELARDAPIVIMTAHGDMATTIRAMKLGAFDYLHKPFEPDEVEKVVVRALELRRQVRLAAEVDPEPPAPHRVDDIAGQTPRMKAIVKEIGKIAASRATVLIQGESGTGKELVARVIHDYSSDGPRPFVGINCSAIVDSLMESELFGHEKGAFTGATSTKAGKFEQAEEGSIFLDELAELNLSLQAKLLRVLQEREFERVGGLKKLPLRARVIAATNRDLAAEVAARRFREDLYQRLKVVTIELPPLRQRTADLPLLVERLLAQISTKVGKQINRVPGDVMAHLLAYTWPGNVRELENALTRAVVLSSGGMLMKEHLPALDETAAPVATSGPGEGPLSLAEAERRAIVRAMESVAGHKGRACRLLGISRPTLERKLRKHRIEWSGGEGPGPASPPERGPRRAT